MGQAIPEVTAKTAGGRPPAVALEGVAKKFGAMVALRDISFTVAEGEFVCFLGPSGCGKTTLLRIVAGLERQNVGVVAHGRPRRVALPPSRRNYGIVFQSYALFPNLTVARNVAYGLEARRAARRQIEARVDELLELVDLRSHKLHYPAQLSGGQQQRVALARALAPSPSLLLLDEPLSALDARVRLALRQEMKALQRRLGDHHRHGHPRPGRGAHDGRPHRGDEPRRGRADRHARRDLPRARLALRRPLRRAHEPARGGGR